MGVIAPGAGLAALLLTTQAQATVPRPGLLRRAWRAYDHNFIQHDGRVIDPAAGGITTSEGQAYGLTRAVWADDRATFDRLLRWTRDNLQSGDPAALPAWRWGQAQDGSWGVLDAQPAADADVWMAHALLIAADQWEHPAYADQAQALIQRIWATEVAQVGPWRLLLPGPWALADQPVPVNPSYWFFPAFRAFAAADPAHPWMELVDHGYALLGTWMAEGRMPPDWAHLDPLSGIRVDDPPSRPDAAIFGFEAMRLPFTLAAEVAWYDETRARVLLVNFAALGRSWRKSGRIAARLDAEGQPAADYEHLGLYGSLLPAWALARPDDVLDLYTQHIAPSWQRGTWGDRQDYYAQNLVWMGIALWTGLARPPEMRP